jgi:putative flippase GtrA
MSDTELLPASIPGSAQETPGYPRDSSVPAELGREPIDSADPGSHEEFPLVDIAIPVYNEEEVLESSIRRLRDYLDQSFPFTAAIVIVDNASTDRTWEIASKLCNELPGVHAIHLDQKGKGRAVRTAWTSSQAPIVAYMDADLSTGLDGLLPLVATLLSGHSQLAIGTRTASGSRVLRSAKREFISQTYNLILRIALHCRFSDAQCGFKAMRRDALDPLLSRVEDDAWFFDTELLVQAERNGLRIHEVPVDWIDDPDSRVNIGGTMWQDICGVWRMVRQRSVAKRAVVQGTEEGRASAFDYHSELTRYASVGLFSTIAHVALFFLLQGSLGMFGANVVAATATSVTNTIGHLLFTFRSRSAGRARYAIVASVCSLAVAIGFTSAALAATSLPGHISSAGEVIAIVAGMVAASCVRFVLLREWAFRNHARTLRSRSAGTVSAGDPVGVPRAA